VVPNKIDRLFAAIIDDAENGKIGTEPCANFNFGSTFCHQVTTVLIKLVASIESRSGRDHDCQAGTFSVKICAANSSRKQDLFLCKTARNLVPSEVD
jgi:hypothetical protein